ncbi:unnamed protein product [Victoria cruziana]
MGVASEDGSAAKRFWIKFEKESLFGMYSPFLVGLASGTLELEAFRRYVSQDVHFLQAFVQAYEIAEECADDDDAKASIFRLKERVSEEIKLHSSFVEAWGVDPVKEDAATNASTNYIEFLLATAAGKVEGGKVLTKIATPFEKTKIAAYTVSAIAPFMRLHAFLGRKLQGVLNHDDNDHPYQKWIENYASESFEALALSTEELLDKLSVSLTGEELEVMERLYHQAIKLETKYFEAQPVPQRSLVPFSRAYDPREQHFLIFSDFDLICTVIDTSAVIAEIAILSAAKVEQDEPEDLNPLKSSAELRRSLDALSRQYSKQYEQFVENIVLAEEGIIVPFAHKDMFEALEPLSEIEKQANKRVVESEVLKGLNLEDIKRAGEHLKLHSGCTDLFQEIVQKNNELNGDIHIFSYCWCMDLIKSAFSSGGLEALNVHSNEFVYDHSISTGEIVRKMESPIDKVHVFKDILKNYGGDAMCLSVYIGDSVGDLLCLIEADVGIVIGSSPSLRKVGTRFGVTFVPLFTGVVKKQKESVERGFMNLKWQKGVLYTASSWTEIRAFILGS